jgi:hypothetical protein
MNSSGSGKLCMCSRCSEFFCFWIGVGVGVGVGGGLGGGFFHFPSFSMSSHQVPNGFSLHSQFVPHVLNIFLKMFPMGSHHIPNLFHMFSIFSPRCSQWVLIAFPICSTCSQNCPQDVPNSTSFLSHMLWQMLSSSHLYSLHGTKGRNSTLLLL